LNEKNVIRTAVFCFFDLAFCFCFVSCFLFPNRHTKRGLKKNKKHKKTKQKKIEEGNTQSRIPSCWLNNNKNNASSVFLLSFHFVFFVFVFQYSIKALDWASK